MLTTRSVALKTPRRRTRAWFLVFALLGYVVYASLYAGAGALLLDWRQSRQATLLIALPSVVRVMLNPRSRDLVDQQLIQWKALDLPEASATDDVVEEAVVQEPTSEDAVEATEAEETE